VSTDDGTSWTRLNGTVGGEPIWEEGEVEGLDGTSAGEWVELVYDMSDWAGQSDVLFRFSYVTDGGYVLDGFFADQISIWGDDTELLTDGAEDGDGPWTSDGFVRSQAIYEAYYPQRYWIENRQLVGADAGYDNSPYNFFDPARPDWVEHFPYGTNGVQLWYNWDAYSPSRCCGTTTATRTRTTTWSGAASSPTTWRCRSSRRTSSRCTGRTPRTRPATRRPRSSRCPRSRCSTT
jgi:immune inhibitor A